MTPKIGEFLTHFDIYFGPVDPSRPFFRAMFVMPKHLNTPICFFIEILRTKQCKIVSNNTLKRDPKKCIFLIINRYVNCNVYSIYPVRNSHILREQCSNISRLHTRSICDLSHLRNRHRASTQRTLHSNYTFQTDRVNTCRPFPQ